MVRRAAAVLLLCLVACPALQAAPGEAAPEVRLVVEAQTRFALDLYSKLRTTPGNLLVSPYSVSSALSLVSAGARGATLDELTRALHLPPQKVLHPAAAAQLRALEARSRNNGPALTLANRLWLQEGIDLEAPFLDTVKRHYRSGLETLDFARHPEVSRLAINRWVHRQTGKRIADLLPPGSVKPTTSAVLTNAVHFKGAWATPLRRHATQAFHVTASHRIDAPMMGTKSQFALAVEKDVSALELPYRGGTFSMVILLPAEVEGLAALEKRLNSDVLARLMKGLERGTGEVRVRLPLFAFDSRFALRKTLEELKVATLFSREANLKGMSRTPLGVSEVHHKATIRVDEKGTEAAAATGVTFMALSGSARFEVDRPFLFLIRHRATNTILFLGRVTDPTRG